ncbi:di-heme oxidoredictase family protein [Thiomicrospira sp. WB1]|uniref:di-heme oxidoreductase family protein n=1 Tax=Thiomicrospira sp. WB1 TaxID=1685380 RepID=UPI0009E83CAB|nr:di-heme oxidoredictase family protein [Thiomicrospira sp. WB1]
MIQRAFVLSSALIAGFPIWLSANPALPGGEATTAITPFASSIQPAPNLPEDLKKTFYAGKALAHQPWVKAPSSTTARDGLGPIYNARTCLACHINGGKGRLPNNHKERLHQGIVRLSLPGEIDPQLGVRPVPHYGDQIQSQSIALAHQLGEEIVAFQANDVRPEANITLKWQTKPVTYPDGTTLTLRYPRPVLSNLHYGPLPDGTRLSLRNAPALHGVGLLSLIPASELRANAKAQSAHPRISGRLNQVWDPVTQRLQIGRFGWKANQPSVEAQTATAFRNDVGITNPIFPEPPCETTQSQCLKGPHGNDREGVELPRKLLDKVVDFTHQIGVPAARAQTSNQVKTGQRLFARLECVVCHRPSYQTQPSDRYPNLAHQTIWPYTDGLLHDMGEALADGRPDFEATGREWKTPPLWGVGLSKQINGSGQLLHDGRARTIEEAILWHGGEAQASRDAFMALPKSERKALIKFIETL